MLANAKTAGAFFVPLWLSLLLVYLHRYAIEYLTSNWERLREFSEAFSGVDLDKMRKAVQPLLVAEGQSLFRSAHALGTG